MEGTWWTGMPSDMKRLKLDGLAGQENCLTTNSAIQNSRNVRRLPLGEISHNQLNIQPSRVPTRAEVTRVNQKTCEEKSRSQRTPNISIRNERERNRVKLLNLGFERLRSVVPCHAGEQLSKISTLKKAIWYIEHLDRVLHGQEASDPIPAETADARAAEALQLTGNSGTGDTVSQPSLTRDPRVITCQQMSRLTDSLGPLSTRGASNLTPGTTSWTTLPPASLQEGEGSHRISDSSNNNNNKSSRDQNTMMKAMKGLVRQQGHLSPIFPKQWDSNNNDCQTPPKISNLFKSQAMSSYYNEDSESMHWSSLNPANRVFIGTNPTNHYAVLR